MKKLATMFISMILVLSLLCACGLTDKLNGTDTDGKKYQKYSLAPNFFVLTTCQEGI